MSAWLVTGGSGFLGRHLLDRLRDAAGESAEVVALGRRLPDGWPAEAFVRADLDDAAGLARAIAAVRPEFVLHLAGRTPPADGPAFFRVNVGGTVALLRALAEIGRPCRVVTAGSAAELGPVPEGFLPADERTPCRPEGPYGLSKWSATRATIAAPAPIEGIAARIFNPIGPGMPAGQAFGRFAARLAEAGPDPIVLRAGNLDPRRDLIDARDVADALIALALRGRPGKVYHVGTGRSRRIGDGLDRLVALSGRRVTIEADPRPPAGPLDSRADIAAIVRDTGWSPRIPFEASLADLWESVRSGPARRIDPAHAERPARIPPLPNAARAARPGD